MALKTYRFKVVVEPDEDALGNPAWHAHCPALEKLGAATSGVTREEALTGINEVIHMIVQELTEEGKRARYFRASFRGTGPGGATVWSALKLTR